MGEPDQDQLCDLLIVPLPPAPAEQVQTITSPAEQETVELPPLLSNVTTVDPFLVTVRAFLSQDTESVVDALRTRAVHVPVPEPAFSRITFQFPLVKLDTLNGELLCVIVVLKPLRPLPRLVTAAAMLLTVELDVPLAELVCGTSLPFR